MICRSNSKLRKIAIQVCALAFFAAKPAVCLDPRVSVTQYLHTRWTQDEGIDLPAVRALAQTSDGYLWLLTDTGLIRFDGMRFVEWKPGADEKLPLNSRYLGASPTGALWIGSDSGIGRLEAGKLHRYPDVDRWLDGKAGPMAVDSSGKLWLTKTVPAPAVAVLSPDGSLRPYGVADGLPDVKLQSLWIDRRNALWIGMNGGLCGWLPGTAAVCSTTPGMDGRFLVQSGSGELLALDNPGKRIFRFPPGTTNPEVLNLADTSAAAKSVLKDRDGNIWLISLGQGLLRLRDGRQEQFTQRDGLSNNVISSLIEDREGNIWIGTARGIDRFRDPKVARLSSLDGLSSDVVTAIHTSKNGTVWVGTAAGLNRLSGDRIARYDTDFGLPGASILSVFVDDGEGAWAGTSSGLAYFSRNRFHEIRTERGTRLDRVGLIVRGSDGLPWVVDQKLGMFAVRGRIATPLAIPKLEKTDVFQIFIDRNSAVWLGLYYAGGVTVIEGDSVRSYSPQDGLAEGAVQAIAQDSSGAIWIGTRSGLSRFRNGRWTTWNARHGIPPEGVRGILEDNYGSLWLTTATGLSQLSLKNLSESPDGAPRNLNLSLYGQNYGLRLAPRANMANPRGVKAADGRLWIATMDGVAILDPARIRNNVLPPPVVIEEMLVDGNSIDFNPSPAIGFRGRLLQITYTGPSLEVPERVRFRHKLEGFDRDWVDAGAVRTATYGNLPPSQYRFRVIACNNDGVWNETGAAVGFRVLPYFYQTYWFRALCILIPVLLGFGVHRLRVQRVVSRFRLIAEERARLTREIHDSLLQGFSGVIFKLEAAARLFDTAPEASRQQLQQAIEQADDSLLEARHTIQSMRLPALENRTLPEALSEIAGRLTQGTPVVFDLEVKGPVRHLPYDAQAGVYFIGREAITNSVNHARATRIQAGLTYSEKELRLMVQDDGSGFDPETAAERAGHCGMAGMRERAAKLGATFNINSSPGRGTKIEVVVPRK